MQFRDPYYQGFAAQVAFYLLLSLVPIVIVTSQLLGFFSISIEFLVEWVEQYVTSDFVDILEGLFSYTPSGTLSIVFIVIAIWAGSKAQFALMRITNYTITGGKSTGRGYFRDRIRAMKTMIFTVFTFVFALIILVYGEVIVQLVVGALTETIGLDYEVNQFWLIIRWPVATALYFLMVTYNYYVLPTQKVRFREILPGSIFASVAMLIITFLYSFYVSRPTSYDIIYGSLATIVALMMWFFFLSWALGLGVLCNKVWADTKGM